MVYMTQAPAERSCQPRLQGTNPVSTPPYLTCEWCRLYQQSLSVVTFEWVTAVSAPRPPCSAVASRSWPPLSVWWERGKNSSTCFVSRNLVSEALNGLGCWVFVGKCACVYMYTSVCVCIYLCIKKKYIYIYIHRHLGLAVGPRARRPRSHYHLEIG